MAVEIQVLYFDGCPNHEPAERMVRDLATELGSEVQVALVNVPDAAAAERERFLGSPTVRVNGTDIEPGAHARTDFGLSCRMFATPSGLQGQPDVSWLRDAVQVAREAESALADAAIDVQRRGRQRASRLSAAQRDLYVWILTAFAASGEGPSKSETRAKANELDLDPDDAVAVLAREDLVHMDESGTPAVAYPFSGRSRRHRVHIDGRPEITAMCAIDALGMAPMLGETVRIESLDPTTDEPITVRCTPALELECQPATAVVVAGHVPCGDGPSYCGCCDVLNFFATQESATAYLGSHPEITGSVISVTVAAEAGRIVFGDVLAPTDSRVEVA